MEPSFDLDVNNYTTSDLIKFFKLENIFSLDDLTKKEEDLATEILSTSNTKYNAKYKFDIINFIKSAKEVLKSFHNDIETNIEIKKNIEKFMNKTSGPRVGKIINPLSSHQTLEHSIIPPHDINGYDYNITTSIYVLNTAARNDYFSTQPSNSTYDLSIKWRNVISISLSAATIPNVMYAFNEDFATNQIYIEEDNTGLSAIVTLPEGNYTPYATGVVLTEASFPNDLTKILNEQVLGIINPADYRFFVVINVSNHKTQIYNTTNTFRMDLLKTNPTFRCSTFANIIFNDYGDSNPSKYKIPLETYFRTMGFLMGYREVLYSGSKSYISESIFVNKYSNYLYFVLEDYTGSRTNSNTYGILGQEGILDGNILAVIPISSNIFSNTFDNNANFIYKKREYFGPVDISRITIKLLNQTGEIVNLQQTDFNFTLEVKTIYNLTQKSKMEIPGLDFL